jgi:DNA-binding NarL/FixJ family response regulator
MTRAVIIADSGAVQAEVTQTLLAARDVEIVRHVSGRSDVSAIVEGFRPELVIVDEMHWPPRALTRIAEARRAAPAAAIVVRADRLEGGWLAQALRVGASAVIPAQASAEIFRQVLGEVLAPTREVA